MLPHNWIKLLASGLPKVGQQLQYGPMTHQPHLRNYLAAIDKSPQSGHNRKALTYVNTGEVKRIANLFESKFKQSQNTFHFKQDMRSNKKGSGEPTNSNDQFGSEQTQNILDISNIGAQHDYLALKIKSGNYINLSDLLTQGPLIPPENIQNAQFLLQQNSLEAVITDSTEDGTYGVKPPPALMPPPPPSSSENPGNEVVSAITNRKSPQLALDAIQCILGSQGPLPAPFPTGDWGVVSASGNDDPFLTFKFDSANIGVNFNKVRGDESIQALRPIMFNYEALYYPPIFELYNTMQIITNANLCFRKPDSDQSHIFSLLFNDKPQGQRLFTFFDVLQNTNPELCSAINQFLIKLQHEKFEQLQSTKGLDYITDQPTRKMIDTSNKIEELEQKVVVYNPQSNNSQSLIVRGQPIGVNTASSETENTGILKHLVKFYTEKISAYESDLNNQIQHLNNGYSRVIVALNLLEKRLNSLKNNLASSKNKENKQPYEKKRASTKEKVGNQPVEENSVPIRRKVYQLGKNRPIKSGRKHTKPRYPIRWRLKPKRRKTRVFTPLSETGSNLADTRNLSLSSNSYAKQNTGKRPLSTDSDTQETTRKRARASNNITGPPSAVPQPSSSVKPTANVNSSRIGGPSPLKPPVMNNNTDSPSISSHPRDPSPAQSDIKYTYIRQAADGKKVDTHIKNEHVFSGEKNNRSTCYYQVEVSWTNDNDQHVGRCAMEQYIQLMGGVENICNFYNCQLNEVHQKIPIQGNDDFKEAAIKVLMKQCEYRESKNIDTSNQSSLGGDVSSMNNMVKKTQTRMEELNGRSSEERSSRTNSNTSSLKNRI
ncbi:MAG: hypothetical protein VX112_04605 [Pseudomonadota bacterium]|nr:hypothetical protein [Pseudomonadota bacterium]